MPKPLVAARVADRGEVDGVTFDGSAIEGFARQDEADMIAVPDPATFQILPWRPRPQAVARMFCDIRQQNGDEFLGDPRQVLKRVLSRAAQRGYTFYVSPEIEYFYFKDQHGTEPLDQGGYFDLTPLDGGSDLRRETIMTLEDMGIGVALSHHEGAPSQHEMDLRYTDALTMADAVMTFRLVVKEVAMRHGVYATFMPKPIVGQNGSAMHLQQSLFRGERNAFFDAADPEQLSGDARHYMAGLLRHAGEIALITNQWVNSYKRLVPGYEAPVYVCWARRNRSALVRIPQYKPGKEEATRIEFRSPDPSCNPYLAFASMLAAGLAGVERKYELGAEAPHNIYEMTEAERAKAGIRSLPEDLYEAIRAAESSDLLRETLGEHVHEYLLRSKRQEWDLFKSYVSPFELQRYLPIL